MTNRTTKEDAPDGHSWTLIEGDSDFNPATMADNEIYIGQRKYVAEDMIPSLVHGLFEVTIPAMLQAAREEGALAMREVAANAILHDHNKPIDNRIWVDERPYVCEENTYWTIRYINPKEVVK